MEQVHLLSYTPAGRRGKESVHHAALLRASQDDGTQWGAVAEQLLPGAHVVLMGDTPTWERSNLAARKARLEVRDAVAVLSPKGLQFAVLLRKPLEESSITEQLLKTGTGALNVDASRVFTDWNESDRPDSWKKSGHSAKPEAEKIAAPPGTGINCHPKGRWPANLVLVHGEGCELAGVKKVKNVGGSSSGVSAMGQSSGWNKHNNRVTEIHRNRDKDGLETVANWNCAPGCPVAALDRQSGVLKTNPGVYSGGASRFYRQFKNESELLNYLTALILPETGTLLEGFPS